MTLSGRPLLDNRRDAELFVDRERELADLSAALRRQLNVLVSGDAGIGKTSLLHALIYRERAVAHDSAFTYIRAEGIADGEELLATVAAAVSGTAPATAGGTGALLGILAEHAQAARTGSGDWSPQVMVVDDVTAAAGHALFGQLRDELWSLGYQWVVAVRSEDRGGLSLPPADAFFEHEIVLAPLPLSAAVEFLGHRVTAWAPAVVQKLAEAIGGNPRLLLDAARTVAGDPDQVDDILDAISRRDAAITRAGRPEAMVAAELTALGAASASDEALLSRLGWTRSRAVQVLTRLEELGLVRGEDVKLGRGRPRKVYRLTPPSEFEMSLPRTKMTR